MAKKKKIDVNRGTAIKPDRRIVERREAEQLFWSKIYNGLKKFLESPFKN